MNDMAMSEALRKAGLSSSFERIINLARDAWSRIPGRDNGSYGARHRHVRDRLSNELTFIMMRQWQAEALRKAINYLLESADPRETRGVVGFLSTGGSQSLSDTQSGLAPASLSPDPAQAGGEGQCELDTQSPDALAHNDVTSLASHRSEPATATSTPTRALPAAPSLSVLADKQVARAGVRIETAIRYSRLDTVYVQLPGIHKPIGDCTVGEVREWVEARKSHARAAKRDVRFAMILIANLASNAVIREHWTNPDEVDSNYAKAEAENAA